ncbi:MAG: hypothetical protein IPH11_14670 [Ignavibacteriales bacterium]|nr:hypothetical protein [Ignavibacteriales bacterium]
MKQITLLLLIGFGLWVGCSQSIEKDDPQKLKDMLVDYFDGIKNVDLKKMNENTTTDYLLFESGKIWNNDSLYRHLQNRTDTRIKFRFDNFKIYVDNESGHISYFNYGDFYVGDTLRNTKEWVENATFRKEQGKWKIDFLQSTLKSK